MSSIKEKMRLVWYGFGATRGQRIRGLILEIFLSFCMGASIFLAFRFGDATYPELLRTIGQPLITLIAFSVTLTAGFIAHWFKRKNQHAYGRVELVFGAFSAFAIASSLAPGRPVLPQCVSLVGCAYVIARGLNNQSEAHTREIAKLFAKLRKTSEAVMELSVLVNSLKPQAPELIEESR